jgi:hypothetical protein
VATVPSTFVFSAGSVLPAATLNTYLSNAVAFFLSPPTFEGRQTSTQSLTSGAGTAILLDTEDVDNDNGHSTVTNTSRYTAQTAGRFQVSGGVGYASNATGARLAFFAINAGNNNGSGTELAAVGGGAVTLVPARTKTVFLNVGDYVELFGLQSSGGALGTDVTTLDQSTMSVRWVGTT